MIDALALQIAIHLFVHGTAVLAVAWLVVRHIPDWPAASRYAAWTTAFVILLLLPAGYGTLPGWELDLIPASPAPNSDPAPAAVHAATTDAASDGVHRDPTGTAASDLSAASSRTQAASETVGTSVRTWLLLTSRWLAPGFLLIWAAGVLLLLGRLGLGMVSLWTWKQQGIDLGCSELTRKLAGELDLDRPFKVLGSPTARVPIVWGAISPVIVLPTEARHWPRVRLRAVLLHELAHIKRWDYLAHFLGRITRAFFWLNPLIWKAIEQSKAAQEQACDDVVLRSGVASWEYAEQLLAVVKTLHRRRSPAEAVAINSGLRFKSRIRALLQPATSRRPITRWEMGAILLTGAAFLVAMSAFRVGSSPGDSERHEHRWIEAESASMPPAFARKNDEEASQGTYVKVTDRVDDLNRQPQTDPAVYTFETSRTGRHAFWARVRVRSDRHDSFWIRVDSTRWIRWNGIEQGDRWHWVQVRDADREHRPVAFDLSDGEHELMIARREAGIAIDQLLVTTDWNYQPRKTKTKAPRGKTHRIWLEAEEGDIEAPLRVAHAPGASGWQHIQAHPDDVSWTSPPETGHATYSFSVPRTGTYRLWGRVIAKANDHDSFWIRMNDGPWVRWNGIQAGDRWHWDEVHDADRDKEPVRFELSKGTHRLTVAYREKHTKLDRLLLTNSPTYRPRGAGAPPDSLEPVSRELSMTNADLVAPMILRTDSQSANPQPGIEVPDAPDNDPPAGGPGAATFTFSVPHAGRYVLWGEVQAPAPNDNSFYVSVNGGEEFTWHTPAPRKTTSDWQWDPISDGAGDAFTDPVIFSLEAGTHTLRIRNREDGTRLRRLRITNTSTAFTTRPPLRPANG